jgi:hypothetical protein
MSISARSKLAMDVGGEYKQLACTSGKKLARETRVDADVLIATLISMAGQLPDLVADIRTRANGFERNHELIHSDIGALTERLPDKPLLRRLMLFRVTVCMHSAGHQLCRSKLASRCRSRIMISR